MEPVLFKTPFKCPACGGDSRITVPATDGIYKITCFYCKSSFMGEFTEGQYHIPGTIVENKEDHPSIFPSEKIEVMDPGELNLPNKVRKINITHFTDFLHQRQGAFDWFVGKKKMIFFLPLAFLFLLFIVFVFGAFSRLEEVKLQLGLLEKNQPLVVLDRKGVKVSEIFQKKVSNRKLENYPPILMKTVLGVEDRNFYQHFGIDIIAMARAMMVNIASLRFRQGASTITQQLARIILDDRSRNLWRKLKEAQVAMALEWAFSKDEILNHYLNLVYLGHGAFGYEEAARFYFHREIENISSEEILILTSIAASPGLYSPLKNPEISRKRVAAIGSELASHGYIQIPSFKKIDEIYISMGTRSPHETVFGNRQDSAPWVSDHVRKLLEDLFPGRNLYKTGGLVIETTLDGELQSAVNKLVTDHLHFLVKTGAVKRIKVTQLTNQDLTDKFIQAAEDYSLPIEMGTGFAQEKQNDIVQAAVVGMDPFSGDILFLHGGNEFNADNQFNHVTQMKRQTGSTIKPILYAAAINEGIMKASSRVMDAPLYFKDSQSTWTPKNTGSDYDGEISLREALAKSKNSAAVQVAELLGLERLDTYFTKFFFPDPAEKKKRFRNDLSLALGSLELSPLEMTLAYGSFANDGVIQMPHLVKKISTVDGRTLFTQNGKDEFDLHIPKSRRVMESDTVEVIASMLMDSANASGLRKSGYKGFAAGKTGTTNDSKDAWFVGFRPGLAVSAWIGYDNPEYSLGPGAFGGTVTSVLWGKIMKASEKTTSIKQKSLSFSKRAVIEKICTESGLIATEHCLHTRNELFKKEYPERKTCKLNHKGQSIKSLF